MRRTRGRSAKGKAAHLVIPWKKTRNITTMAAISFDSIVHYKVLDGNGDTASFLLFLTELFQRINGRVCTIVMDNASFHRTQAVHDTVAQSGHSIMFLPPYSPFFNPIEFFFAQWKSFVAAENCTSHNELLAAIDSVGNRVNPENLHNYFNHVNSNCVKCLQGETTFN